MPKNSTKIYSSNATKSELQALCEQHGLSFADEQGKALSVDKLQKKLDEFATRESKAVPTLAFDVPSQEVTNDLGLEANTTETVSEEANGTAVVSDDSTSSAVAAAVADDEQPAGYNEPEKAGFGEEKGGAVTNEQGPIRPAWQTATANNPSLATHERFEIPERGPHSFGEKIDGGSNDVSLNSITAEPSKSAASATADDDDAAEPHPTLSGPFYLQLQVRNLGYYLSRGIIYPLVLEPDTEWNANRPTDSLTESPAFLPVLPGRLADFSGKHVLVELLLLPDEIMRLKNTAGYYALREPLPVSRIWRVYFSSLEALTDFRANASLYENYFFPEGICEVISASNAPVINEAFETAAVEATAPDPKWESRMRQFDKQLGLFGYLKHAPLLRANVEGYVQDFPAELLVGLQLLNGGVVPVVEVNKWVMSGLLRLDTLPPTTAGQRLFATLIGAIYAEEEASISWALELLRRIEEQCAELPEGLPSDIRQLRTAREQLGLLQLDKTNFQKVLLAIAQSDNAGASIPKVPFAALVLLAKFPGRARTVADKQSVLAYLARSTDQGKLKEPALDQLLAVLGLYYGYARLTRQDPNLHIKDTALATAARPLHRLRFDIGLPADRIIVETVFRFVVEGKPIEDTLTYLQPNSPEQRAIQLPQRSFRLADSGGEGGQPTPSLPVVVAAPKVAPLAGDAEDSAAIYQGIIRKMMGWFAPMHFEGVLAAAFTPAEQEALRRLRSEKKNGH